MRKRAKKLLALLTAVTVTVTGVNVPAAQAAKVKVTASKTTLYYNGTSAEKKATVTVKNVKGKKVTYSISKAGKKIVKLGDVSGNKTKKFTVTAKKAGKATVTVKVGGKKVKSIKFTVKKKTTKATPEPTVAPTQAPTQEPSQEPTVAPSDEPTVAPTDAPSDAPTATPSEEPVKDKSVVTEIKILNETALTSENGKQAYVYYDVLDQYGETMRESCTIEWTTNPSNYTVDKATGKITITKDDGFAYGNDIVLVGVHAESGVSKQANVKVGLTQQVDTISFEGFVNSTDTTKKLDAIGADFANGTSEYYLLFKTYDQNGNVLDVTESEEYTGKNLTFVADNPLVLGVKSGNKTFTIGGTAYAACKVTPGLYAGKGGEVNITAISTKTGNKSTQNIVVGGQGVLQSLELQAPTKTICDGDSIELDYVAKDTAGNEVKNYETIVRSANKLSIDASAGTLTISENNDGTAKITWTDEYDATSGAADGLYSDAISYDGISRLVTLNTLVIGGDTNYIQLSVSDARIPVAVSLPDFTIASRSNKWMEGKNAYTFKDQYGATLKYDKASAFLTYAAENGFGKKGEKYKLFTKATDNNAYAWGNASIGSYQVGVNGVTSVQNTSVYASIRKYTTPEFVEAKSEDAGKKSTFTVTAVPLTKMVGFEITGADSVLEVQQLDAVDKDNKDKNYEDVSGNLVNKAAVDVTKYAPNGWTDNRKVEVAGLYKGQKLQISGEDFVFDENVFTLKSKADDGSIVAYGAKKWNALITSIKPNQILAKKAQDLKNGDFKEFALDLKVTVSTGKDAIEEDDKDVTDVVTKPISFSMADEVVTSVSFGIKQSNPDLTDIDQLIKDVTVLDQYGYPMDLTENDVTIKASDVVEAVTEFTHADSSLVILNNGIGLTEGASKLALKGAEIGDTLKVTATVKGTKVTSSTDVKIGADSYAKISAGKVKSDADSTLCREKLGYSSSK